MDVLLNEFEEKNLAKQINNHPKILKKKNLRNFYGNSCADSKEIFLKKCNEFLKETKKKFLNLSLD